MYWTCGRCVQRAPTLLQVKRKAKATGVDEEVARLTSELQQERLAHEETKHRLESAENVRQQMVQLLAQKW